MTRKRPGDDCIDRGVPLHSGLGSHDAIDVLLRSSMPGAVRCAALACPRCHRSRRAHIDAIDEPRPKGKLQAFEAIMQTHRLTPCEVLVVGGDTVTLVGFGTFSVARRRPRTIRNPRTGQAATVSGRIPRFKPSAELKRAVR